MIFRKLLTGIFVLSIATVLLGTANAQCDLRTLTGDYDVMSQGWINAGGNEVSVALIVLNKFDGRGNITAAGSQSVNGAISTFQITGTYTLLPDCTGTTTQNVVINGTGRVRHFDIVASGNGKTVHFINTDAGGTRGGTLIKSGKSKDADDEQNDDSEHVARTCTLDSLNGAFNYDTQGTQQVASVPKPQAVQMQINFDGEGSHNIQGTQSLDGAILRFTGTGTYALGSDCTGTMTANMTFSDGTTATHNFNLVANADGTQFFSLRTDAGSTQAASATRVASHKP